MTPEIKAERAKTILADNVFIEAFDMVQNQYVGVFKYPTSSDDEIMEAARMVRALALVKGQLQSFVDTGRLLERKKNGKGRQRASD
jgi:hypothetical protein